MGGKGQERRRMFLLILGSGVQSVEWAELNLLGSGLEGLFVSHSRVGICLLAVGVSKKLQAGGPAVHISSGTQYTLVVQMSTPCQAVAGCLHTPTYVILTAAAL